MEPRVWVCGLCRVRNLLPCWITGSSNSVIPNHRVAVRYRFVDQLAPTHGRNNHLCPYFSFDFRQSFISKNILFWKITEFFQLHLDLWSLVKWAKWRRLNDLLFWKTLVLKIEMILSRLHFMKVQYTLIHFPHFSGAKNRVQHEKSCMLNLSLLMDKG